LPELVGLADAVLQSRAHALLSRGIHGAAGDHCAARTARGGQRVELDAALRARGARANRRRLRVVTLTGVQTHSERALRSTRAVSRPGVPFRAGPMSASARAPRKCTGCRRARMSADPSEARP